MFCIKIADIPIGIDNRYPYVRHLCREYIALEESPAFTVRVSEEEIRQEQNGNVWFPKDYCEGLCIYRKICYALVKYDAFLIHSAVVAVDGEGYVFAAPSGVGKTTHIRLWMELFGKRARVINGDKPIFHFIDGRLYACGTPWQGKENLGSNLICPVQGVCFLEQSSVNYIRPLNVSEVTRYIFSQVLIPKEKQDFDSFWKLLEKMIVSTDVYLLQCTPQLEAAQLAYEKMRRKE
mgnify:CR=1 FL=1